MIRNIFTNFTARLGAAVMSFCMLLLTTHLLGKDVRGEIAAIQLGISIIHLISDLAGGASLVYLVPRTSLRTLLLAGSAWAVLSAVTTGWIMLRYFDVFPPNYEIEILVVGVLLSLHSTNQNILLGQQRIAAYNILYVSQAATQLGVMVLSIFAFHQAGAYPFLYASIAGYGLCYLAGIITVNRNAPVPKIAENRSILFLLFMNGVFTQGANFTLKLVIGENYSLLRKMPGGGDGAVGIYSTAYSLGETILLLASSIAAITLSHVSNQGDATTERIKVIRLSKISLVLTVCAVIAFAFLPAGFYSWLLGGKDYEPVRQVFLTLSPGILLLSFGTVYSHYFSGAGKHFVNFISGILSYTVILIVAPMLIGSSALAGAGWSASITYGVLSLFVFLVFMLTSKGRKGEWKTLLPSAEDFQFVKNYLRKNK